MGSLEFNIPSLKIYSNFSLNNINFVVPNKTICALIGNNGSGKTSLINLLVKNQPCKANMIFVNNIDLNKLSYKELSKFVSYVPQINYIYPELSVWDFVSIGRLPHTNFLGFLTKKDKKIINNVLDLLKINHLASCKISQLSGGQLQKIIVANALVQETSIVVFDEPLNHLDLKSQEELCLLIKNLRDQFEKTILVVLHDIEIAANLADKIVIVNNGKTPIIGAPINVITSENIKAYFGVNRIVKKVNNKIIIVEN